MTQPCNIPSSASPMSAHDRSDSKSSAAPLPLSPLLLPLPVLNTSVAWSAYLARLMDIPDADPAAAFRRLSTTRVQSALWTTRSGLRIRMAFSTSTSAWEKGRVVVMVTHMLIRGASPAGASSITQRLVSENPARGEGRQAVIGQGSSVTIRG